MTSRIIRDDVWPAELAALSSQYAGENIVMPSTCERGEGFKYFEIGCPRGSSGIKRYKRSTRRRANVSVAS